LRSITCKPCSIASSRTSDAPTSAVGDPGSATLPKQCWANTYAWRGRPLLSHAVIVNLIAATTNFGGLRVKAKLDRRTYERGISISDATMKQLRLEPDAFHGEELHD
jgi:hypothetical protein